MRGVRPGMAALREDLRRFDLARDAAVVAAFLKRAADRWRHPESTYAPTASGLYQAQCDELNRMVEESRG